MACLNLFKEIKKNNDLWKVRISNFIYDELLVECKNELLPTYQPIVENCMRDAANFYINNDKEITMSCTANLGNSWYDTK